MEFFKHNTKIDFMGLRKWAAFFSAVLIIGSFIALCINGLQFGLDFTGGMEIEVHYSQSADLSQIRSQLQQAAIKEAIVKYYGSSHDVLITLKSSDIPAVSGQDRTLQQSVKQKISQAIPTAMIQRIDFVGPKLGKELATGGALALVVALIGTMIYILLRFEYRFAISAALALIHDPILILGIFALFRVEFDVNALGALLAVIGYSLNDTIVVFDRVRENFRRVRKATAYEILNLSINQTLSRTVMTSGLTLVAVVVLFFFGGAMIHSFSLAMIIGIVIGTYSSIYVAGALAMVMGLTKKDLMPAEKKVVDELP